MAREFCSAPLGVAGRWGRDSFRKAASTTLNQQLRVTMLPTVPCSSIPEPEAKNVKPEAIAGWNFLKGHTRPISNPLESNQSRSSSKRRIAGKVHFLTGAGMLKANATGMYTHVLSHGG